MLVQSDYFQDDLFPPTRILWEPSMSAQEWFAGSNVPAKKLDLKPDDMDTCKYHSLTTSYSYLFVAGFFYFFSSFFPFFFHVENPFMFYYRLNFVVEFYISGD